jgi:DNA-binding PadR family transcriptional regulator
MLKYALLGLIAERPRHGYDLKVAFEELLAGTWPLNIGQVYTTLARLDRDGLVTLVTPGDDAPAERKVYGLTEDGALELKRWLAAPAEGPVRLKDELFLKVLVHSLAGRGDPRSVLWAQREQYLRSLAELTRRRAARDVPPATALLLEGAVLHVVADRKWLELVEDRVDEWAGRGRARRKGAR